MIEKLIDGLLGQGVLGVIVIGIAAYVIWLQKQHRAERSEWKDIAKDSNEAMRQHTEVIAALKTLLETRRK